MRHMQVPYFRSNELSVKWLSLIYTDLCKVTW